jgi:hypothetical protein
LALLLLARVRIVGRGLTLALLLGLLANLTVIGSVAPSGIVPFNFWIARSASIRWSKRMKPTPLERPAQGNKNPIDHYKASRKMIKNVDAVIFNISRRLVYS